MLNQLIEQCIKWQEATRTTRLTVIASARRQSCGNTHRHAHAGARTEEAGGAGGRGGEWELGEGPAITCILSLLTAGIRNLIS